MGGLLEKTRSRKTSARIPPLARNLRYFDVWCQPSQYLDRSKEVHDEPSTMGAMFLSPSRAGECITTTSEKDGPRAWPREAGQVKILVIQDFGLCAWMVHAPVDFFD
jgi:hypothetical protein